jgi:mono/diheme cytochrome c family protein
MTTTRAPGGLAIAAALLGMAGPLAAQTAATPPPPKFDAAYLSNPAVLKTGQEVWVKQCRHCHGASAYPGKAPKLNPGAMELDHIYDRVTYGFRGMPSWEAVFSLEERKAVTAYIKSSAFSP